MRCRVYKLKLVARADAWYEGTHGVGADMDLLALLPSGFTRDQFFTELPPLFSARSAVSKVSVLAAARVPVIKFQYVS